MSRSRSWLGKLGGLLAACLVIAMVAGPMIDSLTCQGDADDKAAAVALVDQPETADAGPDTGKIEHRQPALDLGLCVHGHCHHGVSFAPEPIKVSVELLPRTERLLIPTTTLRASLAPSGLERPPRACARLP
jgi:hypothetical protein